MTCYRTFGEQVGEGVDYATLTMGTDTAADLLAVTLEHEPGKAVQGFGQSEQRVCLGGHVWRRWDPHQSSERWGTDYESWDASSGESRWLAGWCRGRPVRPSRIDVAFDYCVTDDVLADAVAAAIADPAKPTHTREGCSLGISGQGGVNTLYVGAASSDRRMRIYRRDLKDAYLLAQFGHPVLRVELVLKREHAQAWWPIWETDEPAAMAAAAAHVHSMSGLVVRDVLGTVPKLKDRDADAEAGQAVFQFIQQHGRMLEAIFSTGVDLVSLTSEASTVASRMTAHRTANTVRDFQAVGADAIEQVVRTLLRAKSMQPAT